MGTRRRDAERRQVSLAVEALEDRFLLSGAASISTLSTTNGPSAPFAAAHYHAAKSETPSPSPQAALGHTSTWQSPALAPKDTPGAGSALLVPNVPVKPAMGYSHDGDGNDDDELNGTDGEASRNAPLMFALSSYDCNDAMTSLDCPVPSLSAGQAIAPAANVMSFLPLLSASGFGAAKITPLLPAIAISENASVDPDPAPGKEEIPPMPAVPQAPHAPKVVEPAEPPAASVVGPLAELLPIDVEVIQQGVDAFFQQLGDLSEEWREGRVLDELAPWLLAASLAGYGWIRLRDRDRPLADLLGTDRPEAAPPVFLPGGEGCTPNLWKSCWRS